MCHPLAFFIGSKHEAGSIEIFLTCSSISMCICYPAQVDHISRFFVIGDLTANQITEKFRIVYPLFGATILKDWFVILSSF